MGDWFVGLYKLGVMFLVYASFSVSVLIGRFLQGRRSVLPIGAATFLGSIQCFLVTNFAIWWLLDSYPKTAAGLAACHATGLPLFWNTLAGDAFYATLFFGAFSLAEHFVPILREAAQATIP